MRIQAIAILCSALVGCGGAAKSASGTLDPATGGTVAMSNGSASVVVGANALTTSTQVTVTADSVVPPASLGVPVSGCFRFGPEGQQFQSPVTVTLALDSAKLPAGSTVSEVFIATAAAGSSDFSALSTTVADTTHVTAQTNHFSVFCALAPPITDASIPQDAGIHDLAAGDGPAATQDLLTMPSSSPNPSCSPYPEPPPSPACTSMLLGNNPSPRCGWELECGVLPAAYSVQCTGQVCICMHNGTQTQSFVQITAGVNYCDLTDGGTGSGLWQKCCFPAAP